MKLTMPKLILLITALAVSGLILAGSLDPPGAPTPTMVTLQQIYDKLGARGPVARTGQFGCWNAAGGPIGCAGTGQDGALGKGVSVSPRFTDNSDGTVKDNLTGLIWLKNANCFNANVQNWNTALSNVNSLASGSCGLTDGSVAGDWRLPSVRELESLIDYGHLGPTLPSGHPFTGFQNAPYWTSTTYLSSPNYAWVVNFFNSAVSNGFKTDLNYALAVRGGQ